MKGTHEEGTRRGGVVFQIVNNVAIAHPWGHEADLFACLVQIVDTIKRGNIGMMQLPPEDCFFCIYLESRLDIVILRRIWGEP